MGHFRISLLAPLLIAVALPIAADTTEERAARYDAWRETLRQADAAQRADDLDRAITLFQTVIEEAQQIEDRGLLVTRAHDGLGDLLRRQQRPTEAITHYRAAAAGWTRLLRSDQPRHAVTLHHLGLCYIEVEQWEQAEKTLRDAIGIWNRSGGSSAGLEQSQRALRAAVQRRAIPWPTEAR